MSFSQLNLSPTTLAALNKCGYKQATPIQRLAIPKIMQGKDIIATAQTGTGKTAAFVLPALEKLAKAQRSTLPSILILAPVRELANQITTAIHKYSQATRVNVVSIVGGMPYQAQLRQLQKPTNIIVATPGRLIDYLKQGKVNLSHISMLVLDEADRMLDMGFIEDVKYIAKHLPKQRQTLLFTATMDKRVTQLAHTILQQPERIAVEENVVPLKKITQTFYLSDDAHHKNKLLQHIFTAENIYKAIIFCSTKYQTDKLAEQLHANGYTTSALHGDIKQRKRVHILNQFYKGKINLLIATDVAARGIDVPDISHVINYDIPRTAEDYVHRIGRTGRAGREGIAISFILTSEMAKLKRVEHYIDSIIPQVSVPGLEAKAKTTHTKAPAKKAKHGKKTSAHYHGKRNHQEQPKRDGSENHKPNKFKQCRGKKQSSATTDDKKHKHVSHKNHHRNKDKKHTRQQADKRFGRN